MSGNGLTNPRFADDPPIKLRVDAKVLGLVIGILSIVATVAWILVSVTGLWVVGTINAYCSAFAQPGTSCGTTSGIFALGLIGFLLVVAGYLLAAFGGFRMFAMVHTAKRLAIYGSALAIAGGVIAAIGYGGFVSVLILDVVLGLLVYYLIVISRFPDEDPLIPATDSDW